MEIIIEIEDESQRSQIETELKLFGSLFTKIFPNLYVTSMVVPLDFSAQVNILLGTTNYIDKRGYVTALARYVERDGNYSIVFSPKLFEKYDDTRTRFFLYFHELTHVWNGKCLSKIDENGKNSYYLHQLDVMYDEYVADRTSYLITDALADEGSLFVTTDKWVKYIYQVISDFGNLVFTSEQRDFIQSEVDLYRSHGDISLFSKRTRYVQSSIMIFSVHAFATFHHYPQIAKEIPFNDWYFVNKNTIALMDYLEEKYSSNATELDDGIELIRNYIKNFGIDRLDGEHFYAVDL